MDNAVAMPGPVAAKADRRSTILRVADDLLAERGLDGLTIRAVLERTGLARRAFYDQFASKDDLVLGLFEHTLANAAARLEDAAAQLQSPLDRLRLIVTSIVVAGTGSQRRSERERDLRSAAFSLEHLRLAQARPRDLQRAIEPLVELIARIIADGVAQGAMHSPSPSRTARFLYNLVSTTAHTELLNPAAQRILPDERERLAEQVWDFCVRALSR